MSILKPGTCRKYMLHVTSNKHVNPNIVGAEVSGFKLHWLMFEV